MDQTPPESPDPWNEPFRPQFSLGTLMKLMVLASVLCAALGVALKTRRFEGSPSYLKFFVLAVGAPLGLMILMSLIKLAQNLWHQWRERRRQ